MLSRERLGSHGSTSDPCDTPNLFYPLDASVGPFTLQGLTLASPGGTRSVAAVSFFGFIKCLS